MEGRLYHSLYDISIRVYKMNKMPTNKHSLVFTSAVFFLTSYTLILIFKSASVFLVIINEIPNAEVQVHAKLCQLCQWINRLLQAQ